jgi:hypothetical protein
MCPKRENMRLSFHFFLKIGSGLVLGIMFSVLFFFGVRFPCNLQHFGAGSCFSTVLQHFGVRTFHFSWYLQHFGAHFFHIGWYFATRVHLGFV